MSAIISLPEEWNHELCFECKFLFERGDARFVPAVVLHVGEPLFEGERGPSCAPLCGMEKAREEPDVFREGQVLWRE